MDPEKVLAEIQAMVAEGLINEAQANELVAESTDKPNLFALRMSVESAFDAQEAEELAEIGENPVKNFAGAALQGATFGFADELVSAAGFEHLGQNMRENQEIREERAPGATALAELAGGLALPGIPAAGAARLTPGATRGALRGAARGGLFGAVGGAASGAGFADEGERGEAALRGAQFGAGAGVVLGAPMGALGGLFGSASGRGARVADRIVQGADVESGSLLAAKGRVAAEKTRIQEELYRPLSQAHAVIDDPGVSAFLQNTSTSINTNLKNAIPRQFRAGQTRIRSGTGRATGQLVRGSSVAPSFDDLQGIRQALRDRAYDNTGKLVDREALDAADELTFVLRDVVGPSLDEADAAWRRTSANERAVDKGWDMFSEPFEKMEEVRGGLTPEQQRHFDEGRVAHISAALGQRDKAAVSLLQRYLDPGRDTREQIRSLFPADGVAFNQLERMLKSEATTAKVADFFNSTIKSGAIGATGGAITGGLVSREN